MSTQEITKTTPQALDTWFLDMLACPGCSEHLSLHLDEKQETFRCECGRYAYPIRDGIPILLVEEATILDPNISPGEKTK
jgi:uncharacterized protein